MSNSIDSVLGGVMGGESYYDPSEDKPKVIVPEGDYYAHVKEFTVKEDVVIRNKYLADIYNLTFKLATENWLQLHQIPYDRLLFDRPHGYINVDETPSHAKFYKHIPDLGIVAELYEEWKYDKTKRKEN